MIPAAGGRVSVRAQTRDAGRALAATGIFTKSRGGQGALVLTPLGQKSYDGKLTVANLRVKDAPVLASLLSAASGVGLLEQLSGDGILFSSVDGAFRLTPNGVSVTRGAAVGASMGVTMTGNYYPQSKTLNMKGVISPFYLVNGIGQVISKQGEGLFGFNYSLRGSSDAPKVSINPLSVLAPGGLRELFRAGPPKVLSE
uniref:AsmA-like C-terminal region-containing protein n=1 Tax=Thioclava electrotropha TaxID=1549850 RepID=UPI001E38FE96|nr:AsmA-like C-terminal region-containing protein [Thioclava electrotropha]